MVSESSDLQIFFYHDDISLMEKRYQGKSSQIMLVDYCCTLKRDISHEILESRDIFVFNIDTINIKGSSIFVIIITLKPDMV